MFSIVTRFSAGLLLVLVQISGCKQTGWRVWEDSACEMSSKNINLKIKSTAARVGMAINSISYPSGFSKRKIGLKKFQNSLSWLLQYAMLYSWDGLIINNPINDKYPRIKFSSFQQFLLLSVVQLRTFLHQGARALFRTLAWLKKYPLEQQNEE